MTTPLMIIQNELPYYLCDDIINHIKKYLKNDIVYQALAEHFDYLIYRNDLYQDFVIHNYVIPQCNCFHFAPENGNNKMYNRKECSICFMFDSTTHFVNQDYQLCITDNPQYFKIYREKYRYLHLTN